MSKVTELASGQLTALGSITIELVEADQTPAVIVITWPNKATVLHPRLFPEVAAQSLMSFMITFSFASTRWLRSPALASASAPGTRSMRAPPDAARLWAARRAAFSSVSASRAWTLVCTPRRMSLSVIIITNIHTGPLGGFTHLDVRLPKGEFVREVPIDYFLA
jgi:hypothetical protein